MEETIEVFVDLSNEQLKRLRQGARKAKLSLNDYAVSILKEKIAMKKTKEKKDPVLYPPSHFHLVLQHTRKIAFLNAITWLLQNDITFKMEHVFLEDEEVYQLTIDSCWASNLEQIAQKLADYEDGD